MPQGDHTGPIGWSPGTGRGIGYGRNNDAHEFEEPCFGPGWRRRGWGGQNWRQPYSARTREETLQMLKTEADWLQGQLEAIHKSIAELEERSAGDLKSQSPEPGGDS